MGASPQAATGPAPFGLSQSSLSQAEPLVPLREVADDLLRRAKNLERYPFVSATMAEAAKLAGNELRKVRHDLLASTATHTEGT